MTLVGELFDAYENAETLDEAERALDAIAAKPETAPDDLGELYDELATIAAEEDEFGLAVRVQRKAIEHECKFRELAREMVGWYLLKDDRREAAEAQFAKLRAERPDDPHLLILIANARSDAGHMDAALEALDVALDLARRSGDRADVESALVERKELREELGLEPDADDLITPPPRFVSEEVRFSLSWFPRDQHAAALERWPDLNDDLGDPDRYCREIEGRLREAAGIAGRHPRIAPLEVQRLLAFADEKNLDPGAGATRAHYAAELDRRGEALSWPPGRNEPCWCGSRTKYKRCCGRR